MPLKFGYPGLAAGFTLALFSLEIRRVWRTKTYLLRTKPGASTKRENKLKHFKIWTIKQQQPSSTAIRVFSTSPPATAENADACFSPHRGICEFAPRSRRRGYIIPQSTIANWLGIVKVEKPETNIVEKFRRYASRATFPSASCANASRLTLQRTVTKTG